MVEVVVVVEELLLLLLPLLLRHNNMIVPVSSCFSFSRGAERRAGTVHVFRR